MPFRFHARSVFLTYPQCSLDKLATIEHLSSLEPTATYILVFFISMSNYRSLKNLMQMGLLIYMRFLPGLNRVMLGMKDTLISKAFILTFNRSALCRLVSSISRRTEISSIEVLNLALQNANGPAF